MSSIEQEQRKAITKQKHKENQAHAASGVHGQQSQQSSASGAKPKPINGVETEEDKREEKEISIGFVSMSLVGMLALMGTSVWLILVKKPLKGGYSKLHDGSTDGVDDKDDANTTGGAEGECNYGSGGVQGTATGLEPEQDATASANQEV